MVKFLLVLLLTLPAYTAFAQLSEADTALIAECSANIDPAQNKLSPETGDKCVKGLNAGSPPLVTRYSQEDPEAAGQLIGYNNALVDLKRTVVKQEGVSGAQALSRILENPDCALCDMTLGPTPESTFDWLGKFASDRVDKVKESVRTWDALGDIRRNSLSSADYGKNKEDWNSQSIIRRYFGLAAWASSETAKLQLAAAVPGANINVSALSAVLRADLTAVGDRGSLKILDDIAAKAGVKAAPAGPSAADQKSKDLAAAADKLSAINPDGRGDYLAAAFDKAKPGAGAAPAPKPGAAAAPGGAAKPAKPVPMTDQQKADLSAAMFSMGKDGKPAGYLADVMAQTEAGKRTIGFYSDPELAKAGTNKLDFTFKPMDGAFGVWNADKKTLSIGSEVVEQYAAGRGMTVEALMKDKAAMKDLALHISPTFVHEAEHQNQTARAIAGGYDYVKFDSGSSDPYTRAKENLSNKWSSEHMIEYCSKNGGAGCFKSFHEMHADNADKFMQGGLDALDSLKAPLYPRVDSLQGGAAREFKAAADHASVLKALEAKNRSNPAGMTAREKLDMKEYRELMDTRFKWYTSIYRESEEAEAAALAFRKKYGTAGLGLSMPAL